MPQRILREKSLFLFDLDGVFYKGKEKREKIGGTEVVDAIRKRGSRLFVLTNNSTDSVSTIFTRLNDFGIGVGRDEILTSSLMTADYIRNVRGPITYFLIGEEGLEEEMATRGHRRTRGADCDFVVVGLDRKLTYEKLDIAARAVMAGASFVATHDSRLYMSGSGPAVAAGPLVRAIEYATGVKATVVGKPSPLMFRFALTRAGVPPTKAVMVGDQVDTDVLGANRADIDAILVRTGIDRDHGGTNVLAVIDDVDDLIDLL